MTDTLPPEGIAPVSPEPPPPPTAEFARPAAYGSLAQAGIGLDRIMVAVNEAQAVALTWTDDFWAVSGYDKEATLASLDRLVKFAGAYTGANGLAGTHSYQSDGAVLQTQSPA